jgi:hypothetical protein
MVVGLNDAPESIVDYGEGKLNVLCKTVDTYPLDNAVDLMAPPSALTLLVVVHDTMLYLGKRVSAVSAISRQSFHICTLLYSPLPSGSASTTRTSSAIDLRN